MPRYSGLYLSTSDAGVYAADAAPGAPLTEYMVAAGTYVENNRALA